MAWPPVADTLAALNSRSDASVQQFNDLQRATVAALINVENALNVGQGNKKTYKFVYDFAVQGGAIGDLALTAPDGQLPANFVIQSAWLDVLTAFTGAANAELALSTGVGAGDLVASAVVTGAPWSTTGRKVTIPLFATISTWIKTVTAEDPVAVASVGAITAGKFNLFLEGYLSA